jgi:pimeloyl-ACP methyl ester carboxylesterase
MNRPIVWIAMTVLAVAAAAAAPAATAQVNPPPVQWGACPSPPPGIPAAGMQCGTVTVPLDYSHPDGGTIDIAVSIIRAANPATRHGVLLVNPGGPGGAGIQIPRVLATLWPQSVFATYDVVGFDPRGVDLSAPVTCGLTSAQSHRIFPTLQEPGGFDATVTFAQSIANACADSAGATLPFINTANTARDMDVIRQALGESSISYFAFSYGTYLGAVYASLYPSRADRFVLDSNVDPSWVWRQQYLNWGPGGQVRWPDFANYAAANNATYGFGSTSAQVTATFQRLVTELDATPIAMPALFSDGTIVDGELFRELTFGELEADEDFPTLALIWNLAIQGLGGSAATGAPPASATAGLDVPADNQSASGLAVTCNDAAASRTVAQYQAQYAAYGAAYPLFGSLGSNIWPCAFWSTNPIEPPVPITAAGPSHNILLLQNLRDEATFYPGVLQMHADLGQRSLLVTVDEGGHGIYGFSTNTCVTDITTTYLTTGVMPSKDTYCPAQSGATPAAAARAPGMAQQAAARDRARAYLLRQMIPARRALPQ